MSVLKVLGFLIIGIPLAIMVGIHFYVGVKSFGWKVAVQSYLSAIGAGILVFVGIWLIING